MMIGLGQPLTCVTKLRDIFFFLFFYSKTSSVSIAYRVQVPNSKIASLFLCGGVNNYQIKDIHQDS